jgi:hypothetical protein
MPRIYSKTKPVIYTNFAGLNSSMGEVSMENPEEQRLLAMDNAFCSVRGYISNEAPYVHFSSERNRVTHVKFHDTQAMKVVYAVEDGAGTSLACTNSPVKASAVFPSGTIVSSASLNRKTILVGHGQSAYKFDGHAFAPLGTRHTAGARFVCTAQNRLFLAGFNDKPTRISASRVNMEDVMPDDEAPGEGVVTKAAFVEVDNMLSSSDRITGIGAFESNRIAVFTNEKTLVYIVDPDLTQWKIDSSVAINYGTVSNNSIVSIGGELFFCSRSGVHSIRRSALNGITIFTLPLSDEITELYQSLVENLEDKQRISACYNPDEGRLHVYIPTPDAKTVRLSVSVAPAMQENQKMRASWSMSKATGVTCGTHSAGEMVCGTNGGLLRFSSVHKDAGFRGDAEFTLPILYQKDMFNQKQGHSVALLASGSGLVQLEISDETGRHLGVVEFDMPAPDSAAYSGVPLQRQFTRPFRHKFMGIRIRCLIKSERQVRIYAIGVFNQEE